MQGLGELEALVMDVLWRSTEPVRVRDVIDGLDDDREPAYTTVMTVMDNLHRKGWVHRQRNGRAYWYEATRSREEAAADGLRALLESASST
ncbi:BlaI/MecI/CopY family transcriptional regulator [Rhodococcus qingshengii]|uniref:BlaI/MecI/CopY family transcriptional regulator n=1 Tax=Rhodococcus qingshengii TaxID=334542 RepID=UPI001F3B6217